MKNTKFVQIGDMVRVVPNEKGCEIGEINPEFINKCFEVTLVERDNIEVYIDAGKKYILYNGEYEEVDRACLSKDDYYEV